MSSLPQFKLKIILFILIIPLIIIIALLVDNLGSLTASKPASTPPPSPEVLSIQGKTKVKYPQDYTIVLVGDSMTEKLGNSDEIRANLKEYYPNKTFEVLNYGFGSTSILTIPERLEKTTFHTRDFRPILDIDFDLILIESMGHNPLSQYSVDEGLKKQTETLDLIVNLIEVSNPRAKIIFVATIAPNKKNYALNQVELTAEKREDWANEREAYIKNHLDFARVNNIPFINIYEKSMNKDGNGNLDYIDKADYIHPSPTGVVFISKEIADFIYNNNLLN